MSYTKVTASFRFLENRGVTRSRGAGAVFFRYTFTRLTNAGICAGTRTHIVVEITADWTSVVVSSRLDVTLFSCDAWGSNERDSSRKQQNTKSFSSGRCSSCHEGVIVLLLSFETFGYIGASPRVWESVLALLNTPCGDNWLCALGM